METIKMDEDNNVFLFFKKETVIEFMVPVEGRDGAIAKSKGSGFIKPIKPKKNWQVVLALIVYCMLGWSPNLLAQETTTVRIMQNNEYKLINLGEVEILDDTGKNLALNHPEYISYSSQHSYYPFSKLVDGIYGSPSVRNFGSTANYPIKHEYVLFTFPSHIKISKIKIQNRGDCCNYGRSDNLQLTVKKGSKTIYDEPIDAYLLKRGGVSMFDVLARETIPNLYETLANNPKFIFQTNPSVKEDELIQDPDNDHFSYWGRFVVHLVTQEMESDMLSPSYCTGVLVAGKDQTKAYIITLKHPLNGLMDDYKYGDEVPENRLALFFHHLRIGDPEKGEDPYHYSQTVQFNPLPKVKQIVGINKINDGELDLVDGFVVFEVNRNQLPKDVGLADIEFLKHDVSSRDILSFHQYFGKTNENYVDIQTYQGDRSRDIFTIHHGSADGQILKTYHPSTLQNKENLLDYSLPVSSAPYVFEPLVGATGRGILGGASGAPVFTPTHRHTYKYNPHEGAVFGLVAGSTVQPGDPHYRYTYNREIKTVFHTFGDYVDEFKGVLWDVGMPHVEYDEHNRPGFIPGRILLRENTDVRTNYIGNGNYNVDTPSGLSEDGEVVNCTNYRQERSTNEKQKLCVPYLGPSGGVLPYIRPGRLVTLSTKHGISNPRSSNPLGSQIENPRYMADMNNDGRADIVYFSDQAYVGYSSGNVVKDSDVSVLHHAFGGRTGWSGTGSYDYLRLLGDVDGNGSLDIVGFGYNSTRIALNMPIGTFGKARFETTSHPDIQLFAFSSYNYWSIYYYPRMLADMNGDGTKDIVGFGYSSNIVSLADRYQNGPLFVNPIRFGSTRFTYSEGWLEGDDYSRTVVDLDHDNIADIIGLGEKRVFIEMSSLKNRNSTEHIYHEGLISFSYDQIFPGFGINAANSRRMLDDINGDGIMDLVALKNTGHLMIAHGTYKVGNKNTRFNFIPSTDYLVLPAEDYVNLDRFPSLIGDVNGDGALDFILIGKNEVYCAYGRYFREREGKGFHKPFEFHRGNEFTTNNDRNDINSNTRYRSNGTQLHHPRMLADVDGDGKDELVMFRDFDVVAYKDINVINMRSPIDSIEKPTEDFTVIGAYPNGVSKTLYIPVLFTKDCDIDIRINSLDGIELASIHKGLVEKGKTVFEHDMSFYSSGIYIVSFKSNGKRESIRVIKKP